MNRKCDLGWFWTNWQYWKKKVRANYEEHLRTVFFMFSAAKIFKHFFESLVSTLQFIFSPKKTWINRSQIGQNSQSIVYCSDGDTSQYDFYTMTLFSTTYLSRLCRLTCILITKSLLHHSHHNALMF